MLEEALSQATCRLPSARDTFESLSKLSLVIVLNQTSKPIISELSFVNCAGNNISKLEEQYRHMSLSNGKKKFQLRKMDSL